MESRTILVDWSRTVFSTVRELPPALFSHFSNFLYQIPSLQLSFLTLQVRLFSILTCPSNIYFPFQTARRTKPTTLPNPVSPGAASGRIMLPPSLISLPAKSFLHLTGLSNTLTAMWTDSQTWERTNTSRYGWGLPLCLLLESSGRGTIMRSWPRADTGLSPTWVGIQFPSIYVHYLLN